MIKPKIVLPNYNECLVNVSSSILKRFNVKDEHNSLKEVDEIINNYKKIVFILFDGMGTYILDEHLNQDSFLQKHKKRDITSVFPPTTASATTSFLTCKNPNENLWLGWHMYFKDIDDDLILFYNSGYYNVDKKYENYTNNHLPNIDILERIKQNGYKTKRINSFDNLMDLNDFEKEILDFLNDDSEGFMYAYHTEPDHLMHLNGTKHNIVHNTILNIEKMVKDLANKIDEDTLIIVSADHGHIDCNLIDLYLDEDIKNNLKVKPFGDSRMLMFNPINNDKFYQDFRHKYGGAFDLYTKEEIIENKLFGDKENNPKFYDLLGDYIAIGKSNYFMDYCINNTNDMKSVHSGYSINEMIIPLILINK